MTSKKSKSQNSAPHKTENDAVLALKTNHGDLDHDDLTSINATVIREFDVITGGLGKLTVEWRTVTLKATADVVYEGTLTYAPAAGGTALVKLSCYNIGLQGRRLDVSLLTAPQGTNVQLCKPTGYGGPVPLKYEPASAFSYPLTLGKTGFVSAGSRRYPPNEHNVWGLSFEGGTCTLTVLSRRLLHSPMAKASHDTSPPPDEPGGQDGEE